MVFLIFFKKQFSYMNHQTLFSHFLQNKKVCNNWNFRLLLLHMSLFHHTIWKYVNFLGRKLIYDILRECMAFIISTWAPTRGFQLALLGSKDLGTNVFRTLICNVGKPWSKQVLDLFRLAQSVCTVCKVVIEWLQKY